MSLNNHNNHENLVSVIIPTYNHAQFIGKAIQSVIDQTYKNWECIVVNNFSKDNTVEVVEGFDDSRIRLINYSNKGIIASSRNRGVIESKGHYIAFLDSDDIWFNNKLEKQIEKFVENENILAVASNAQRIPEGFNNSLLLLRNKKVSFNKLYCLNNILNSSVVFKKDIVSRIGMIDESPFLVALEDYDFWLRILYHQDKSIMLLKEPLVKIRNHSQNINQIDDILNLKQKIKLVQNKYDVNFIIQKRASFFLNLQKSFRIANQFYSKRIDLMELLKLNDIKFFEKIFILIITLAHYLVEIFTSSFKRNNN